MIPYPLSSISISFDGFVDKMNIVDILLDDESLMGAHDWAMEYNADTPSGALITASAGAQILINPAVYFLSNLLFMTQCLPK